MPPDPVEVDAARQFGHLCRVARASEPGSVGEAVSLRIMDEANRIDALELPPTEAVLELREFVRSLGLGQAVDRIANGGRAG
jgi:hypothetical protein